MAGIVLLVVWYLLLNTTIYFAVEFPNHTTFCPQQALLTTMRLGLNLNSASIFAKIKDLIAVRTITLS